MSQLASRGQLRMSFLRYALFTVPGVLLLGTLSGTLSGAGADNSWYQALDKPPLDPPGWVFALVWPLLYILLGLSLALVMHARGARQRSRALALFAAQLLLNFAWPPVFFALHKPMLALSILAAMVGGCFALILVAWRVRALAGLILYPYFGWLIFAALLNFQIVQLNPNAERLEPGPRSIDIPLESG